MSGEGCYQLLLHAHEPTTEQKRESIVRDGLHNLHVVLDFDHTITAYLSPSGNGELCHECHDVLQHGPYSPDQRRRSFRADIDAVWSDQREGRLGHISEWWLRFHGAIISHGLTRDDVREAVAASNSVLRPGAVELLGWLRKHGVRTTIVSAGVSTVIEEILRRNCIELHEHAQVLANVPVWNEKGVAVAFEEPLIHSRNKPEVLQMMGLGTKGRAVLNADKDVQNVVLAGNSIGDATILNSLDHRHSLSFGFLHEEVRSSVRAVYETLDDNDKYHPLSEEGNKKLQEFFQYYDVVSCGKETDFRFLLDLFHEIEEQHQGDSLSAI